MCFVGGVHNDTKPIHVLTFGGGGGGFSDTKYHKLKRFLALLNTIDVIVIPFPNFYMLFAALLPSPSTPL